jgi:hypothetical protein
MTRKTRPDGWLAVGRGAPVRLFFEIDIGECLAIEVTDDEARLGFFGGPRRWEAARSGRYVSLVHRSAASRMTKAPGMPMDSVNPKNGVTCII